MELVSLYKKIHKITNSHYIAIESVVHRIFESYRNRPSNRHQMDCMRQDLKVEMMMRKLDQYFQVQLSQNSNTSVHVEIQEINPYHPPKECVVWS